MKELTPIQNVDVYMRSHTLYMQYERRRNYEEAIEHYTKAIEIDPTSEVAALCYSNRSAAHQVRSMHCHFIATK